MAHGGLVRVVAYLEPGVAERLRVAAVAEGRSVSREAARRLEASFRGLHMPDWQADPVEHPPRVPPEPVQREASNDLTVHGYPPSVEKPAQGPAVANPVGDVVLEPQLPAPLLEAVVASKGAVTVGAKVGACPRAHYHRSGRYCSACGQTAK